MKNYIKPTFILAGVSPVAFTSANCDVKYKDTDLESTYVSLDVPLSEYGNTFLESEGCGWGIPDGAVKYCKFTSVETGNAQLFTS